MTDNPLSPHVVARRDELIALEVRRIVRSQGHITRAETVIASQRKIAVEAQENIIRSTDVLHEMYGLDDKQIADLIVEVQRRRRRLDDEDEDDE